MKLENLKKFQKELIDYQNRYIDFLKNDIKLDQEIKDQIIELLEESNLERREKLWSSFKITFNQIKQLPKLANPYYLGYGNPDSEILFIGKEKAFDIFKSPNLFLHESINNLRQWEIKLANPLVDDLVFNPSNPILFHQERKYKVKKRSTWGFYKNIVEKISLVKVNEEKVTNENFFTKCFTTEINHIPSKYSNNLSSNEVRKVLLSEPFFKSFKYVIIGAKGAINQNQIKQYFDFSEVKNIFLDENKKFECTVFKNQNQKIILCNQLSGAAGWTNIAIENLIKTILE